MNILVSTPFNIEEIEGEKFYQREIRNLQFIYYRDCWQIFKGLYISKLIHKGTFYIFVKVDGDILAFPSWKIRAFKGLLNQTCQPLNERRSSEIKCTVPLKNMKNEESMRNCRI